MKKFCLYLFLLIGYFNFAQIKDPIKFQSMLNKLGDNEYEFVLNASIEKNWHVYSKDLPEDSGIPTSLKISSKDGIESIGLVQEIGKKQSEFSEAFGAKIVYYSDHVVLKQKFRLKNPSKSAAVEAEITYQTCNDKVCLAPNTLVFEEKITASAQTSKVETSSHENKNVPFASSAEKTTPISKKENSKDIIKVESIDFKNPLTHCGLIQQPEKSSYFWVLFLGFLGGFIALLTPCVFPMIPLTVSFFTKGSENKTKGIQNALLYSAFILIIFVGISIPFHIIEGVSGHIFNAISTNVWLNIAFFIIFVFFALSFFGYYEIRLPNWIANKSAKAEETGGIIGIFFMALTLVIVSFSCTGPILGSLLGSLTSNSRNIPMLLSFALAGFGLAWAVVFGLLALFPQVLQAFPKSGGWMNTLKVVLGFLELGLALKFLSKADLVSKTFLIKRELFVVFWIIIAIALALYLFGKIYFPHDDKTTKLSWTRKFLGFASIGFVVYLIQGLFPSEKPKLQLLSGILPPINVSYFVKEGDGILGMKPYQDFYKALAESKKENKILMIDFTGYGCENCRKMEEFVWSNDAILPILQNEIIIASLYVDDKEKLPENEQKLVDIGNGQKKKIKSIGDYWSLFQRINFNNNSQPHYVLLTPDGKVINPPVSGYMSVEDFKNFLECGVSYFKRLKN